MEEIERMARILFGLDFPDGRFKFDTMQAGANFNYVRIATSLANAGFTIVLKDKSAEN